MENTKARLEMEIYEKYWKMTAGLTDIYTKEFTDCTRIKFSERYKGIIDRYNAGGTENEDYYEQLIKLMEELKQDLKDLCLKV